MDPLPIGVENYEEIIEKGLIIYVDKTLLIKNLIDLSRKSQSLYPAETVWQDAEYEHAPLLF